MGVGGFIEPAIVLSLLFGGTWVNRNRQYREDLDRWSEKDLYDRPETSPSRLESSPLTRHNCDDDHLAPASPALYVHSPSRWRKREIRFLGFRRNVSSLDTRTFRDRLLSRLLLRFPFLVEVWYWALIYWVG